MGWGRERESERERERERGRIRKNKGCKKKKKKTSLLVSNINMSFLFRKLQVNLANLVHFKNLFQNTFVSMFPLLVI